MKKVVIFYSKTGGGHLRAAEAIADQLKQTDSQITVKLIDALEQTNLGFKINPAKSYALFSNKLLPLYNLGFRLSNNPLGIKIFRELIKFSWGKQFKSIIEKESPDLIVTTHHFISPSTVAKLNTNYLFITVVLDLGKPHRLWFDKQTNWTITPTLEIADYGRKLISSQVLNLGYPIKKEFSYNPKFKLQNRLMITGGGSGTGEILKQLRLITKDMPDKKVIVVCGFNLHLYQRVCALKKQNLQAYQFFDNIHKLMSSCDIIITKAGPATILEAAQMRKPVIITQAIGLQEKENVNFAIENNLGIYCPKLRNLISCINEVYKNYPKYSKNDKNWSGLEEITEFISQLLN